MRTKHLSERAAWLCLAKAFKNAQPGSYEFFIEGSDDPSYGICHGIDDLFWLDRISSETNRRMKRCIPNERTHCPATSTEPVYCWPVGDWASRERFCREQSRRLTRSKTKKKTAKKLQSTKSRTGR